MNQFVLRFLRTASAELQAVGLTPDPRRDLRHRRRFYPATFDRIMEPDTLWRPVKRASFMDKPNAGQVA